MRDTGSACLALEAAQGFIAGQLGDQATERVEEHLDGCPRCRELIAALARGGPEPETRRAVGPLAATRAAVPELAPTDFDLAAPDRAAAGERSLAGRTLADTYQLVRIIGKGGMGVIYEASHVRLHGKRYAVKVIDPQHGRNAEVLTRFRREAEIASRLGNENIVEVHDFNIAEGRAYMVMELLEGEDLAGRLKARGAFPVRDVTRILDQVASALDAAHRAKIVHRDLKPHNVFLCRRGGRDDYVKVLDFGVSKVLDSVSVMTRDHTLVGTPCYMSPEQAEGRNREIDRRTDVFALAAIAWEMLTGQMAFGAQTFGAALHKIRFVDPPDVHLVRPDVAPAVSMVLRRALAKDRLARTPEIVELASELTAALHGSAPDARRAQQPPRTRYAAPPPPPAAGPQPPPVAPSVPATVPAAPTPAPVATAGTPWAAPAAVTSDQPPPWAMPRAQALRRSRKGLLIAMVAATGVAAAGIWLGVAQIARPVGEAREPLPDDPARPAPAAHSAPAGRAMGEPAARPAPEVALIFTVEPARVAADIHVDGKPVVDRHARVERSERPLVVTAEAKGYLGFRAEVVPRKDQIVPIVLRRSARARTRTAVAPASAASAPAPAATQPTQPTPPPVALQKPPSVSRTPAKQPQQQPPPRTQPPPRAATKPPAKAPQEQPAKRRTGTIFDDP